MYTYIHVYICIYITYIYIYICIYKVCIYIVIIMANQDKFTLTKFSFHIEFHKELSIY